MTIAVIGLILGIGAGIVVLYYELEAITRDFAGTPVP